MKNVIAINRRPARLVLALVILGAASARPTAAKSAEDQAKAPAKIAVKADADKTLDEYAKGRAGGTTLMEAAASGNTAAVKALLDKGADIEARDESGQTALMAAVAMASTDTVKVLLEKGAKIEAKDNLGWNALMVAV